jgi:hypothetical protein
LAAYGDLSPIEMGDADYFRIAGKQEVDRKSSHRSAAASDLLLILVRPQATIAGLQDFTLLYQS